MMDSIINYLNEIYSSTTVDLPTMVMRLCVSLVLGAAVGVERQTRRRDAGMRTFTLICLGSTLAMLISIWIPQTFPNFLNGDPGRIAAQVLSGIGFLGAGAIIQSRGSVHGLTTAACIWAVAVIGLAVGAGMYAGAAISTAILILVLLSLEKLERRMYLDGVNKILILTCNTSEPDLKGLRLILESHNIFIVSSSFDYSYEKDTAVITYKVNIKDKATYSRLFNSLRASQIITNISLTA